VDRSRNIVFTSIAQADKGGLQANFGLSPSALDLPTLLPKLDINQMGDTPHPDNPLPTAGQRIAAHGREQQLSSEQVHAFVDQLAKALELFGIAIIVGGITLAIWKFVRDGIRGGDWQSVYPSYRSNIGRGILLGLELLVGADIIATITAPLTFESVGLLAAIVLIRTFLSFSLETEIEGCWPWQREVKDAGEAEAGRR
jgi:uncharacterized membrane protein